MSTNEWAEQIARTVAEQVRRRRTELGMSAQDLSDACGRLGMPIGRSTLANFENGRRASVDLSEVLVFAAALDTSPAELVFPAEQEAQALPETRVPGRIAAGWFGGNMRLDTPVRPDIGDTDALLDLHQRHVGTVRGLLADANTNRELLGTADLADKATLAVEAGHLEQQAAEILGEVRVIRAQLRAQGVQPPELPKELEGEK